MANVIRDPRQHPSAVLGDFSTPNPLVTFTKEDVAFTYGTKWKQRYFTKIGDDFFVFPAQWDVRNKTWRPYYVKPGTDWWTASTRPSRCKAVQHIVRRMPLSQLRHQDEDADGMECRLRKVPRTWQRARAELGRGVDRQPGEAR